MTGRLGNQFFQYATIRAFQIKNGLEKEKIKLDFSGIYKKSQYKNDGREDSLKYFLCNYEKGKIKSDIIQRFLIRTNILFDKMLRRYNKIIIKDPKKWTYLKTMHQIETLFQTFYNKFGLFIGRAGYYELLYKKNKNYIFYGTFESPKYFNDIRNILIKEFTPKQDILPSNVNLYNNIRNSESVCLTIRRGDFLDNNHKTLFYVCKPDYFYKGINLIKKMVKNPKFFVFSDDIERCKTNIKLPKGTQFESGYDPIREKLRLMYSCKHFIISNSSFSRWAQYLSRNKNKIVIAPSKWYNNEFYSNYCDLYQNNWILIDI